MSLACVSKSHYFTEDELALIQKEPTPRHVAIIMDGNRRWAKRRILSQLKNPLCGHWKGANILQSIVEASSELGIEVLTVYAFSTENWNRSPQEISTLLEIFETYLKENRKRMIDQGVRFNVIGDLTPFSAKLREEIERTREETQEGSSIDFLVGMNYGGRDEIKRVIQKVTKDLFEGKIEQDVLTEEIIGSYFDTASYGDPELLIRTSGEQRISNFLLWQLAYTEIYVTEILWPDFTPRDLLAAVLDFQKRVRRKGR